MFKLKLIPTAVAISMAAGVAATVVYADSQQRRDEQNALESAKISLTEAITKAESQAQGRALEVELERQDGAYLYEIEVIDATGVTELLMDPASGKVVSNARDHEQDDDEDEALERAGAVSAQINLIQAINAAEQYAPNSKAKAAGLEAEKGTLIYEIEVLKDGNVFEIGVDPNTGKVLSYEQDDDDLNDDDNERV